jgi:hypothetical protein
MAMNQRRWIGVALSAAWLAGIAAYEIAGFRAAQKESRAIATPLCQQVEAAARTRCLNAFSDFYAHLAIHHAVEIMGLALLACLLGWLAGLFVIKRSPAYAAPAKRD